MTDAETIERLKRIIARWRAEYYQAQNEKLILLRENRELKAMLWKMGDGRLTNHKSK